MGGPVTGVKQHNTYFTASGSLTLTHFASWRPRNPVLERPRVWGYRLVHLLPHCVNPLAAYQKQMWKSSGAATGFQTSMNDPLCRLEALQARSTAFASNPRATAGAISPLASGLSLSSHLILNGASDEEM